MSKLKIMSVVGTRPEIIKLSRIIPKLDEYFNHVLVNTSQNFDYELNKIFFKDLGIRSPDIDMNLREENASKTIAKVIEKTDRKKTILVYCYKGISSQNVAQHFCNLGFENVYSLNGGYKESSA